MERFSGSRAFPSVSAVDKVLAWVPPQKTPQSQERHQALARPQAGSHLTHPPAMGPQKPALRPPLLLLFLLLFLDTSVWARE